MNGIRILKNWGKALGNAMDAFGDGFVKPAFSNIGKVGGILAKKTAELGVDVVNNLLKIDYKKIGKNAYETGKKVGASGVFGLEQEAEFIGDSINLFKYQLLGDAPITKSILGADHPIPKWLGDHTALLKRSDESLLGVKATKKGVALAIPIALVAGTPAATKEFLNQRKGTNDGQLYTNAPINTYGKALGNSYANNAGATGDLVFALHNQRHTGII